MTRMPVFTAADSAAHVRPFLKWAGGKRQLLQELRRFVPRAFGAYHEPLLESGAVFFDLWCSGRLLARQCNLSDMNPDLVDCYRALARDVDGVARELRALADDHARSAPSVYYRVRDERFNPSHRQLFGAETEVCYPSDLAAMFIYLNRTGYSGLFRLNSRGDFNVPMGRYRRPRICDEATLHAVAAILNQPN